MSINGLLALFDMAIADMASWSKHERHRFLLQTVKPIFRQAAVSPRLIANVIHDIIKESDEIDAHRQGLYCVGIDQEAVIVYADLIATGFERCGQTDVKEVFRRAIRYGVNSIAVCHSIPQGPVWVADEDEIFVMSLIDGGKLLGITSVDHLLVNAATGEFRSFRSAKRQWGWPLLSFRYR
ncbi:MAG: JAB domain-containing protein [Planctomycetota bacterium]